MPKPNFPVLKEFLTRVGARLSARHLHWLNGLLNYLHAGWWMRRNGFAIPARYDSREELYGAVARQLIPPVTYLEFGVFEGASIRAWVALLPQAENRFHGFDSFEGLPENWRMAADVGTFDVGGRLPQIDDPRVRFHKGWFEETLPPFLSASPPASPLVVHLDADLYSSTKYVLKQLAPWIRGGTTLIFDEFYDREHELKAADEFIAETGCQLVCLGATRTLTQVAFRVLPRQGG